MSTRDALLEVLGSLPEPRLEELLSYAQFLRFKQEQQEWQQAGLAHFARCYGRNEPDYGEAPAAENARS